MKIVVCVKYVPDAQGDRRFSDADHTVDRTGTDGILSELDEYAVEEALKLAEGDADSTVTALTVGPEGATDALRKALQMGATDAVHVVDDALHGSDALATSLVLAKALQKVEYDLVITGMASTDGGMSVVPAMVAERLGIPQVTFAGSLTIDGSTVRIEREGDASTEVVESRSPPWSASPTRSTTPATPPSRGSWPRRRSRSQTWSLADLGVDPAAVGLAAAWSAVDVVTARPPRQAGQIVTDEGDGGAKLVEFLAAAKLV